MSNLTEAKQHVVFPVTVKGDTLVVSPKGPLSQFAHSLVGAESKRVKTLLHDEKIKNLIVDLSESKYFGTAMITSVMEFKKECKVGQTALCGLSSDMAIAVDLCQLEEALPVYENRKLAIKKVSHIPLAERLLPGGRVIRSLCTVLLLAVCVFGLWASKLHYQIIGSPVATDYNQLHQIWVDYQSPNDTFTNEQSARELSHAVEKVSQIHHSLERDGLPKDYVSVRKAAEFLELILSGKQGEGKAKGSFLHHMHAARVNLKRRTGIQVAPTLNSKT